jgi:hypothetical protein
MRMYRSLSSRPKAKRRSLELELLEHRWCPARISITHHIMTVVGDRTSDTITITDDGAGNVSASIANSVHTITGSGTGIVAVRLSGREGSDTLNYTLTGNLTTDRAVAITGGHGTDKVNLDFGAGVNGAKLGVAVHTDSGADTVNMKFGAIKNHSKVQVVDELGNGDDSSQIDFSAGVADSLVGVTAYGGPDDDTIKELFGTLTNADVEVASHLNGGDDKYDLSLLGAIAGTTNASFLGRSDVGDDSFAVHAAGVNIDAGASLALSLLGLVDTKSMSIDYSGKVNGLLAVSERAGHNSGTLSEVLNIDSGSTGKVRAVEYGSHEDDDLALIVNDNSGGGGSSTLALLNAVIHTNLGKDTITKTANVQVQF